MKIHRFIGEFKIIEDFIFIQNKELYNQIKNVLKLKRSEVVLLSDGKGLDRMAEIIDFENNEIRTRLVKEIKNRNELKVAINLYCSILKKENFELVVQKASEIGIKRIIPMISERTIKLGIKPERLKKIAIEASEQSGRSGILQILPPILFKNAVADVNKGELSLFFDGGGENVKKFNFPKIQTANIFIGPEGGFSKKEINEAQDISKTNENFKIVSLGGLTYRAETAAIASMFLAYYLFD